MKIPCTINEQLYLKPLDCFGKMGVLLNFPMSLLIGTLTTKSGCFCPTQTRTPLTSDQQPHVRFTVSEVHLVVQDSCIVSLRHIGSPAGVYSPGKKSTASKINSRKLRWVKQKNALDEEFSFTYVNCWCPC